MIDCNGCYLDKLHETEEEKLRCLHRETCERAYQQGRADAIDKIIKYFEEHHIVVFDKFEIVDELEQLKEQRE